MTIKELKQEVYNANLKLVEYGLVTLTWGNVSGIDRSNNLIAIKPSGVDYDKMSLEDIVVLDLDGKKVEGNLNPSSDTPTHIELYKAFSKIGGIAHTHSINATIFAQAQMEIPCFGTTHADHFYGNIPLTRILNQKEVNEGYEKYTGRVIIERFADLDPISTPGVLVSSHAPFAWGKSATDAVKHAFILEKVAEMALQTVALNPEIDPIEDYILEKHFQRKHGPNAYYGQK